MPEVLLPTNKKGRGWSLGLSACSRQLSPGGSPATQPYPALAASARDGPHADEPLDGPQLVHYSTIYGCVHVNYCVGYITTTLV